MAQDATINQIPDASAVESGIGPTSDLDKDPYSLEQLRYPLEGIGTVDVPSHIVFYINLPTASKYVKDGTATKINTSSASTQNYDTLTKLGGNAPSINNSNLAGATTLQFVTTSAESGIGPAAGKSVGTVVGGVVAEGISLRPKLQRISKSIAIYMPDTVMTPYQHNYSEQSLTEAFGDVGKYAAMGGSLKGAADVIGDMVTNTMKNVFGGGQNAGNQYKIPQGGAASSEFAADIAERFGATGAGFKDITLRSLGKAVNPHAEMIFHGSGFRTYQIMFRFIPKSQKEAQAIYDIIKTFKAFAAPEVTTDGGGRYFIPPAQFDIKYYFMNKENPIIAKVSTCVLTAIQVNYSPHGQFATFQDGMPVEIDLDLSFTEVDVITRELIEKYGY